MISRNADGTLEGYTYDYLQRIAQFTGWTYEFVKAEGETLNEQAIDLMNMLEDGRIDLEGGMTYSPALDDTYSTPQLRHRAHLAVRPQRECRDNRDQPFHRRTAAHCYPKLGEAAP